MNKKKFWSLVLILSICVPTICGASEDDSAYQQITQEDAMRIVQDAQYSYVYDENGLCIAGTGTDGSAFTSTYDMNADGLPVNRYINIGNGDELYETYEYAADGSLGSLTVNPGKEEQVIFQYDEGGRLTYADNYFLFPSMGFRSAAFSWDNDGRLIKVVNSYAVTEEELVSWVARAGSGEEETEENRATALKRLQDFFENRQPEKTDDGNFLLEEQTQTYTYDAEGRVTEYKDTMRDTAVYSWLQRGREIDSYERTDGLFFSYGEQMISIKAAMQALLDGADNGFSEFGPFECRIQYGGNGLPVMIEGINTDIYDKLNCQVVSADIGFYGYWWNDTMLDFMGEMHGGIAGLPFDKASVRTGTAFALRVRGKTETGQDAVYYCMPDMLGRQMCEKFVDGRLTIPCSLEMDPKRRNQIVLTADEDIVLYAGCA